MNDPIDWAAFDADSDPENVSRPYFIEAAMLYNLATDDHARRMVELLTERGYNVEFAPSMTANNANDNKDMVPQSVWNQCLDIISREA